MQFSYKKNYNTHVPAMDWIEINFHRPFTSRETFFNLTKSGNSKVENNLLTSRLAVLNRKIKLEDFNLSLDAFKVKY